MLSVGNYYTSRKLSSNERNIVYKAFYAKDLTKDFAIKVIKTTINKSLDFTFSTGGEVLALKQLKHTNIINSITFENNSNEIYIVMDYYENNLHTYMTDLHNHKNIHTLEKIAKKIYRNLVSAMSYMFNEKWVHRDIKLENILFKKESDNFILSDFEFACKYIPGIKSLTSACGTKWYASPEIYETNPLYEGPDVDIWASGVLLYVFMTEKYPFYSGYDDCLGNEVKSEINKFLISNKGIAIHGSFELNNLLNGIFKKTNLRFKIDDIKNCKWLNEE